MNIKLTVKSPLEDIRYCVLSPQAELKPQLEAVLNVKPGCGFAVTVTETAVTLEDYFSGETRATFAILSKEECDLPVALYWTVEK